MLLYNYTNGNSIYKLQKISFNEENEVNNERNRMYLNLTLLKLEIVKRNTIVIT